MLKFAMLLHEIFILTIVKSKFLGNNINRLQALKYFFVFMFFNGAVTVFMFVIFCPLPKLLFFLMIK